MDFGNHMNVAYVQKALAARFGVQLVIDRVVARNIAAGLAAKASVFFATDGQLYCLVYGPSRLLLGDVKKIAVRIGLRAETFFPPRGQPDYFDEFGRQKFREIFPGFGRITDRDIMYYRTLAPYNPALILVDEVKDGHIYQADSDARSGWRVAAKCQYHRGEVK